MSKTLIILVFYAFFIVKSSNVEIPAAIATQPNATIPSDNNTGMKFPSKPGTATSQETSKNGTLLIPVEDSDTPSLDAIASIAKLNQSDQRGNQGNKTVSKKNQQLVDTEVNDLNKEIPHEEFGGDVHTDIDLAKKVFNNNTFGFPDNADLKTVDKKNDVAEIQSGGNEDDREANFDSQISQLGEKIMLDDGPLVTPSVSGLGGQIPAIVAGIFIILCVVGYTAMLMWRRYLENKYGNREMLVNEEFDPNDMRHFSI